LCHSSARSGGGPAHHPDAPRSPRSGRDHGLLAPFPPPSQRHRQSPGCLGAGVHGEERQAARRQISESSAAGGGRSHPGGRTEIHRSESSLDHRPTSQSVGGHRALPHRRPGGASGSLCPLRVSCPLLQFLPQSALSQVSGPRSRPVAPGAPPRTFAHPLRPCHLHASSPARPSGPAEQEGHLRSFVPRLRRNADGSGTRPPPSRCLNRLLQRAPQLESETRASPPSALCGSGRRPFPRPPALDPLARSLLSSRPGAASSLSRQVRRRSPGGLRRGPTRLLRRLKASGGSEGFRFFPPPPLPSQLGGLLQSALRWSRTC